MGNHNNKTRRNFMRLFSLAIWLIPFQGVFGFIKTKLNRCVTGHDVQGPFHRASVPYKTDLSGGYRKSGTPLTVSGKVMDSNCTTPLTDVLLDIWHADPEGNYDMKSDKYLFMGKVKTDSEGEYQFRTYMPHHYTDNGMDRPRHIHYKVSVKGYKLLTTQLYFRGDARMDNDHFVNQNNGWERAMPLKKVGSEQTVVFDIFLEKTN